MNYILTLDNKQWIKLIPQPGGIYRIQTAVQNPDQTWEELGFRDYTNEADALTKIEELTGQKVVAGSVE